MKEILSGGRKMKSKIILTALALMLLTISAASAWQMSTIGVGHNPSVYSNLVAWSDDTSGNGGNIHVYDLSAKKDTVINTSSAFYPAIYGNKLVWNDQGSQIAVYDLKSKNGSYISQNADTSSVPKIYGNVVVWSANDAVHMYDLSKSNETEIGTGKNPNIDGTKISYTDDSFSGLSDSFPGLGLASAIKVYDISKGTAVSCGNGDNSHISGNKVVWLNSDSTGGQSNLVLFDLSTNKTTNVTSGSTSVGSFDIYGDNIVYVNQSSSSSSGLSDFSDITSIIGNPGSLGNPGNLGDPSSLGSTGSTGGVPCIYSISKGKVTEMANETQAGNIDVYGNTIVWDTPASGSNITVYQAASSSSSSSSSSKVTKPVANFKASKVSGTHPLTVTFTYSGTGGTPDSYTWNFNDKTSTVTTTSKTVTHTFKNKGTYTICCTAKNKAGSNAATKSKYITVK
jgi:plastocyanin